MIGSPGLKRGAQSPFKPQEQALRGLQGRQVAAAGFFHSGGIEQSDLLHRGQWAWLGETLAVPSRSLEFLELWEHTGTVELPLTARVQRGELLGYAASQSHGEWRGSAHSDPFSAHVQIMVGLEDPRWWLPSLPRLGQHFIHTL